MTDAEEEPDEESARRRTRQPDGSSERPGSRFEKFLDRLDEREARLVESEGETASDRRERMPDADAGGDSPGDEHTNEPTRAANATSESDADADGWVWGPSTARRDDRTKSTEERSSEPTRKPESEPDDERIWNAELAERVDRSTTERTGSESDESEVDRGSTGQSPVADSTDETESETPEEFTEAEMRDRWLELGSSLGGSGDETAGQTQANHESRAGTSEDDSHMATSSAKAFGAERTDEEDWSEQFDEPTEETGDSQIPRASPMDALSADLDRISDASSVLVLGPTDQSVSDAICARFLTDEGKSRNVLFVTFDDSPTDRIEVCHRADGWSGGQIGIIEVGRGGRNSPAASEITGGDGEGSITTRHVSKPGDLSKIGIVITQLLSKFDESPRQTVLCFHTLSVLHREVGTKTLFRFLTTLQGRLNTAGAIGHYHMDPDLHDEIVIETLRPIFDSVVRFSTDGEIEIE